MSTDSQIPRSIVERESNDICNICGLATGNGELWLNKCGCSVFVHRRCLALAQFARKRRCVRCPVCSAAWKNLVHLTFVKFDEYDTHGRLKLLVRAQERLSGRQVQPADVSQAECTAAAKHLRKVLEVFANPELTYPEARAVISRFQRDSDVLDFWLRKTSEGIQTIFYRICSATKANLELSKAEEALAQRGVVDNGYMPMISQFCLEMWEVQARKNRRLFWKYRSDDSSDGQYNRRDRLPGPSSCPLPRSVHPRSTAEDDEFLRLTYLNRPADLSECTRAELKHMDLRGELEYCIFSIQELLPVYNEVLDSFLAAAE